VERAGNEGAACSQGMHLRSALAANGGAGAANEGVGS
jgi:hypothetical protein